VNGGSASPIARWCRRLRDAERFDRRRYVKAQPNTRAGPEAQNAEATGIRVDPGVAHAEDARERLDVY
jgi:hypothetical protein